MEPFFLKRGRTGILLIHGFVQTHNEIIPIAKHLAEKDFTVCCPLLPGHGTCPGCYETCLYELVKTTLADWKQEVETSFKKLKKEVDTVYVGGQSVGANLSLWLANEYKDVAGLIVLSCAVILSRLVKLGSTSVSIAAKVLNRGGGFSDFPNLSILNLMNMRGILEETRRIIPKINAPILVLHSKKDKMILPKSALYIYNRVTSSIKKLVWIETSDDRTNNNSSHRFSSPLLSKRVAREIHNFISSLETQQI